MAKVPHKPARKRRTITAESPEAEIAQIQRDLDGLEQLQTMQVKLVREIRRRLEALAKRAPFGQD